MELSGKIFYYYFRTIEYKNVLYYTMAFKLSFH